jgi:polar amino acid transport system substrate-binding protein
VSTKRAADVGAVDDLNREGRIIAVKTGTTGDIVATQRFPKATLNRFKDEAACALEVAAGRADAFLYDQISIAKHQRQHPGTTRALLDPFTYEPFAMAIRKGDFDLWQWLNMFLATLKSDGRYETLKRRHFAEILPGVPGPADGK